MLNSMKSVGFLAMLVALTFTSTLAFLGPSYNPNTKAFAKVGPIPSMVQKPSSAPSSSSQLRMGLDLVTYLRTEWISASICTNQIPRDSKTVLQIGTEDGRAVNFVPRSVEELITSSADADGKLSVGSRRQLKQQRDRRGTGVIVQYIDQPCDDLKGTKDESVDVVISLQAADRMRENGQDWKQSLIETERVLKPGGRFVFVEKTEIEGVKYLDAVMSIATVEEKDSTEKGGEGKEVEKYPVFEMVGYDDVDLVIVPHVAGVVRKAEFAGMTAAEIEANEAAEEKARIADLSIEAFERGLKKRKRKKKNNKSNQDSEAMNN